MKLKHISALLLFLFVFSFVGISQVEDEEVQMFSFSGTRGIGATNVHDFKQIKGTPATFTIELQNTGTTDMKVGRITLPEGVGVTLLKETLKPGEKGGILVTVDPKIMKEGEFNTQVVITTSSVSDKGVLTSKTAAYGLKGQILK